MKNALFIVLFLLLASSIKAQNQLEITAQSAHCFNYEDNLLGTNINLLWDKTKGYKTGFGAGLYYAYECPAAELNLAIKKNMPVKNSIHPFWELNLGSTSLIDECVFSILMHPKFGFEFPYINGSFQASIGYRVDYFPSWTECAHNISLSFGYTFDL